MMAQTLQERRCSLWSCPFSSPGRACSSYLALTLTPLHPLANVRESCIDQGTRGGGATGPRPPRTAVREWLSRLMMTDPRRAGVVQAGCHRHALLEAGPAGAVQRRHVPLQAAQVRRRDPGVPAHAPLNWLAGSRPFALSSTASERLASSNPAFSRSAPEKSTPLRQAP